MIDYLTGYWFIHDHDGKKLDPKNLSALRGHELIQFESETGEAVRESHVPKKIEGLRVTIHGDQVQISGNPTSCVQGFNSFSNNAPWVTVDLMLGRLRECLELHDQYFVLDRITRIDLTQQIYCDTPVRCNQTLQALKLYWSSPRAKLSTREETAYLGQNSQLRTIKAYCKGSSDAVRSEYDLDLASFLRIELCLRTKGMRARGLNPKDPVSWNLEEVFAKELAATTIVSNQTSVEVAPYGLTATMRGHWQSWRSGVPMKKVLKPSSFSYVRRELLKSGVDIAKSPSEDVPILITRMSLEELCDRSRWHATSFTMDHVRNGAEHRAILRAG